MSSRLIENWGGVEICNGMISVHRTAAVIVGVIQKIPM